ncbi:MAG: hypothetical protein HQL69_10355, partial [Magnetococcales bacterium]|nr:hypothetical protein [Magnetococcales bacterium]
MNQALHTTHDTTTDQKIYMALELSLNKWKVAFGNGTRKRVITIQSGDIAQLCNAISKTKQQFGMDEKV